MIGVRVFDTSEVWDLVFDLFTDMVTKCTEIRIKGEIDFYFYFDSWLSVFPEVEPVVRCFP